MNEFSEFPYQIPNAQIDYFTSNSELNPDQEPNNIRIEIPENEYQSNKIYQREEDGFRSVPNKCTLQLENFQSPASQNSNYIRSEEIVDEMSTNNESRNIWLPFGMNQYNLEDINCKDISQDSTMKDTDLTQQEITPIQDISSIPIERIIIRIRRDWVKESSPVQSYVRINTCSHCDVFIAAVQQLYDEKLAQRKKCLNSARKHATVGRPHEGKTKDCLTKEEHISEKRALFRHMKKHIKQSNLDKKALEWRDEISKEMMDEVLFELKQFKDQKVLYNKKDRAPTDLQDQEDDSQGIDQPSLQQLVSYRYSRSVKERFFESRALSYIFLKTSNYLKFNNGIRNHENASIAIDFFRLAFFSLQQQGICFCGIQQMRSGKMFRHLFKHCLTSL